MNVREQIEQKLKKIRNLKSYGNYRTKKEERLLTWFLKVHEGEQEKLEDLRITIENPSIDIQATAWYGHLLKKWKHSGLQEEHMKSIEKDVLKILAVHREKLQELIDQLPCSYGKSFALKKKFVELFGEMEKEGE